MSARAESLLINNLPLDRRRVYILPSRYGLILGVLLFAILLGSINYDNALGYLLTFLIAGLYLVAMLHTYRNVVGLSVRSFTTENGFAGDQIPFRINLENGQAIDRFNLSLACESDPRRWFKRRRVVNQNGLAKVPAFGNQSCTLVIKSTRRGRLQLPRVKISSTFPLGIFIAWGYFPHTPTSLVYPRPAGPLTLPPMTPVATEGQTSNGSGDADFYGLREYSGGEPLKRIAWRALAKYDELLVKQFSGDSDSQLILDWRHTEALGDIESRLSQLCLWVLQTSQAGLAFGLVLPNETIPPGSGETHRDRCLATLAEY